MSADGRAQLLVRDGVRLGENRPRCDRLHRRMQPDAIVYYASWMDQVRHTPAYRHTNTWHTNKVDAGGNYVPDPEGDAMTFLDDCIAKVEDYRNQNDSTVTVSIRFIVHLVGDMHCPGHVKYPWYKSFKFTLSGKEYGLHNYWDEWALTLSNKWHYLEYGHQARPLFEAGKTRYRRRHAPRLAGRQRPRVPRDLRLDQGRSDAFVRGVARLHHFLARVRRGAGAESRIQVGGAAEPLVWVRRLRPHVAPPGMPSALRCDFRGGGVSELWVRTDGRPEIRPAT